MTPIPLRLPGARVTGVIYDRYDDPRHLDEDILQIVLPNGVVVDVGWYPGSSNYGSFKIVVYKDHWQNQLREPVVTRDPRWAATVAQRLAELYGEQKTVMAYWSSEQIASVYTPVSGSTAAWSEQVYEGVVTSAPGRSQTAHA